MPTGTLFGLQGLLPAKRQDLAVPSPVILPAGGPVGVGGSFAQGQAVGYTGIAAQAHIFTVTVTTNGSVGAVVYPVYYGDQIYSGLTIPGGLTANAATTYPTAVQLQNALVATVPVWNNNLTVTGSTGGPYTITFTNLCATKLIGGLLQFNVQTAGAGGTPTFAVTTAQSGSAGSAQVNLYSQATNNRVDGFLQYQTLLDPVGGHNYDLAGDIGQASGGEPAWIKGIFFADTTNLPEKSVVGLDANAMTLGKLIFSVGTTLSAPYCQVELL